MKAIGIDLGTTGIACVLFDVDSEKIIKSATRSNNFFIESKNEWEKIQDVEKIVAKAKDLLDEFLAEDVCVIGVTGQMHGIVYFDKNANSVSPLYTWQDGRGNLDYNGHTYAKELKSFSGYGCVTDFYNKINGLVSKEAVGFCTIADYFVMKICEMKKPILHVTNGASLGCYNLSSKKHYYDVNFDLTDEFAIAGKYNGIPVSIAIGDNQASVFSTLADENDILLNVGTGSQVSIVSDLPITADNIETRPYFENKYLIVGAALCGGRAYSMLKDFYLGILKHVQPIDDERMYEIMSNMIENIEKSSLIVDSRFAGTRSNPNVRGSIGGITTENFNSSQLTLGVLEGMANELLRLYENMGIKKQGVVGSGNGIRKNTSLLRTFERTFGAKLKIPEHLEEAALGATFFGLIACGHLKSSKDVQKMIKYVNEV